jgi:hypothetical protein
LVAATQLLWRERSPSCPGTRYATGRQRSHPRAVPGSRRATWRHRSLRSGRGLGPAPAGNPSRRNRTRTTWFNNAHACTARVIRETDASEALARVRPGPEPIARLGETCQTLATTSMHGTGRTTSFGATIALWKRFAVTWNTFARLSVRDF